MGQRPAPPENDEEEEGDDEVEEEVPERGSNIDWDYIKRCLYIGFGVCIVTVHLIVSLLDDGSETRKEEKRGVVSHEG